MDDYCVGDRIEVAGPLITRRVAIGDFSHWHSGVVEGVSPGGVSYRLDPIAVSGGESITFTGWVGFNWVRKASVNSAPLPPAPQRTPQPKNESPTGSVDRGKPPISIACPQCGGTNSFDQPYRYHAGFSDQGFLYNDAGNLTLVWSSYDPDYMAIVGRCHPWTLTADQQRLFEAQLLPAPIGGAFRFKNPARCVHCGHPISAPMTDEIYYVVYPNSLITDPGRMLKRLLLEPKRE